MRTLTFGLIMGLALALVGCGDKEPTTDAEKREERTTKDDEFMKIMDSIDLNNPDNTSLNVKTAWEKLKGQEVKWNMEVVDVKGGRDRVDIYAKKDGKPLYRGYNIIVTTYDKEKAGVLKKGDVINIRGLFENTKQRKGNPLLLYIGSAQVLDSE